MKKFLSIVGVFCLFFVFGCEKEKSTIEEQMNFPSNIQVNETREIDESNLNVQEFLKSNVFKQLENTSPQKIEFINISEVTFNDSRVKGLIFSLVNKHNLQKDLFVTYLANEKSDFSLLVREMSNFSRKDGVSGEIKWLTLDNSPLNYMKISKNQIEEFELYNPSLNIESKNSKISGCKFTCSNAQFNAECKKAKETCENDWQCDFACSFNPCAIAYLAAATINCTTCNF